MTADTSQGASLLSCPFCGGSPELVDNRVEWFVRCAHCKPFATVIYGESARHIDHLQDGEAVPEVDWGRLRQTAIDAWNRRAPQSPAVPVPLTDAQVRALRSVHGWSLETIRAIEAAIFRQAAHGIGKDPA